MITSNGEHGWKQISLGGKRGTISGVTRMNKDGIAWRSSGGNSFSIMGTELAEAQWIRISEVFELRLKTRGGDIHRLVGFKEQDENFLKQFFKENFNVDLTTDKLCTKGWNWGEFKIQDSAVSLFVGEDKAFDIPLSEVAQARIAAKTNEVTLEFHQDDTTSETVETLVEMRLYFPKDEENKSSKDKASKFLTRVLAKADIISASGKGILTFKEVPVLTPRGRYGIEMFPSFMKLNGKSVEYKIKYSNIVRLFQLPKPDGRYQMFVVSLEPPIIQGHTVYPHIVMQIPEQDET